MRAWAAALLVLTIAMPAEARLGDKVWTFKGSPLLQGDRLFRFEGLYGSRFQFCGARHCAFGDGVLALDVWDDTIDQESLVLPVPGTRRDQALEDHVATLFLQDSGLSAADQAKALMAFQQAYNDGETTDTHLAHGIHLRSACAPDIDSVMLVLTQEKE